VDGGIIVVDQQGMVRRRYGVVLSIANAAEIAAYVAELVATHSRGSTAAPG
jgi:hypothetical protein